MTQFKKSFLTIFLSLILLLSLFSFSASAAGTTTLAFSNTSPKVGDTISVSVTLNAGEEVYGVDGTITYDTSILQYVSGGDSASGNKVRLLKDTAGEKRLTYSVKFKVKATGSAVVSFATDYVNSSLKRTPASGCSAKLTIKAPTASSKPTTSSKPSSNTSTPAKSSNANLSALSIGIGSLSPAFDPNATEYSVTVENSVAAVNITATPANSKATVSGAGERELVVGDNKFAITVTAQNGTKKTYNLTVRRATVEESLNLNPTLVIINGDAHHIKADLSGVSIPAGFTLGKASYNGTEIDVLKSDTGDYTLYMITRDSDSYTDYYVYKEHRDEFSMLNYMTVNDTMYIFAELSEDFAVPAGYYETAANLGNGTVRAFCSDNEALKDFYIIYCYANGAENFYRLDTLDTSIQRAPDFIPAANSGQGEAGFSPIKIWNGMSLREKIMTSSLAGAFILILILIIALLVKGRKLKKLRYNDPISDEDIEDFFNTASIPTANFITEEVETAEETEETAE